MSDPKNIREAAIQGLTEITGTGFFGERQGGIMPREQAERFVDSLLEASGEELRKRIAKLRATLASICSGDAAKGVKDSELRWRLNLVQRAAAVAIEEDEKATR